MPPTSRRPAGGYCDHALNRGNARAAVFPKDGDYRAFLGAMAEASLRHPMRVLANGGWRFDGLVAVLRGRRDGQDGGDAGHSR